MNYAPTYKPKAVHEFEVIERSPKMKTKTIRFGCYWLRVYKYVGELRICGGYNKFRQCPQRQTTNMLVSSSGQHAKIKEFARAILQISSEIQKESKNET